MINTESLDEVKRQIVQYFHYNPGNHNIEAIIDLGLDKAVWFKAVEELEKEGKIRRNSTMSYTLCKEEMNDDNDDNNNNNNNNNKITSYATNDSDYY